MLIAGAADGSSPSEESDPPSGPCGEGAGALADRAVRSRWPLWLQRSRWARWAAVSVVAVVLIAGRYDWSGPNRRFAERGWLLSSYLAVLALPVTYHLLRRLGGRARLARWVTAALFAVLTLPYRWIGVDGWFEYRDRTRPWYNPPTEVPWPRTAFLPSGPWSTFPASIRLFAGLVFAIVAVVVLSCRWRRVDRGAGDAAARRRARTANRRTVAMGAVAIAIAAQTFLHSGVRGPYTYMTHFQGPPREDLWYAVAHYPDGSGVGIADQFVFSAMEQYFHGVAVDPNNMLVRRPVSFYLASQFSFFVNTYPVWLALNMALWAAAVAATAGFVKRVTDERTAWIAAALVACGPGFVAFAGTSGMYLAGFAVLSVALYLCQRLLVDAAAEFGQVNTGQVALFAASLGLCALTYDLTVYFPVFGAYCLARRVPPRAVLGGLLGAYAVYRGFLFCHDVVLGIEVVDTNVVQLANARHRVLEVLASPGEWPGAAAESVGAFAAMLWRMFFGVPIVLAFAGLWGLRDRALQILVGGMLLMTFATVAFLRIGDQLIGWMPRFTYSAYPAVYLLAAIGLSRAASSVAETRVRAVTLASVLGVLVLLSNIDAFGHPQLYYEALEGTRMGTYLVVGPDGSVEMRSQ